MASLTHDPSAVTCCIFPLVSVNRRSRNLTSLSFIILSTSPTDFGLSAIATPLSSLACLAMWCWCFPSFPRGGLQGPLYVCSDCVGSGLAGADADGLLHRRHEDFAVADAPSLGSLLD